MSDINMQLKPFFEELYRQTHRHYKTRDFPDRLLLPAQRSTLCYGLTFSSLRMRFSLFRSDPVAVAVARGATKIYDAFNADFPEPALLKFLVGEYYTSEPETNRVRVLQGGVMKYEMKGKWYPGKDRFKWSKKHRGQTRNESHVEGALQRSENRQNS